MASLRSCGVFNASVITHPYPPDRGLWRDGWQSVADGGKCAPAGEVAGRDNGAEVGVDLGSHSERNPFVTLRLCGAPHNRNYAARTIMRSPRREVLPAAVFSSVSLCIIWLASSLAQHGQELVGCAEVAGLQHWRRHRGERLRLFGRIGSQIDLSALQAGVSEPKRDLPHVAGCLQSMHGAGMPQHMRADALAGDGRRGTCGSRDMLGQDVFKARAGHRLRSGVEEQLVRPARRARLQPRLYGGNRRRPLPMMCTVDSGRSI
jgi:hypothetical protein